MMAMILPNRLWLAALGLVVFGLLALAPPAAQAQVNSQARLTDLWLTASSTSNSRLEISPAFDSDTANYTFAVPVGTTSIFIRATPESSLFTVTGTGSVNLPIGDSMVQILVRRSVGGTESSIYRITFTRPPDPLALPAVAAQTAYDDMTFSLTLDAATGGDGTSARTYSVTGLPAGLTFADSTRVISGMPTTAGEYQVTYSVSAGTETASRTFTLTVRDGLQLADLDTTALDTELKVLIKAPETISGGLLWARGVYGTAGELLDGGTSGNIPFIASESGSGNLVRVRLRSGPNRLNINEDSSTFDTSAYLGGDGSDLTVHVKTMTQETNYPVLNNGYQAGAGGANFMITQASYDIINAIAGGERFIIALTRPGATVWASTAAGEGAPSSAGIDVANGVVDPTPTPPPRVPDYSEGGRQPLEYLFSSLPGGSPVLVGFTLLMVVGGTMIVGRGAAWSGPAAAIAAIAAVGILNAMDHVNSLVAAVIIMLALLAGLAFFRASRAR